MYIRIKGILCLFSFLYCVGFASVVEATVEDPHGGPPQLVVRPPVAWGPPLPIVPPVANNTYPVWDNSLTEFVCDSMEGVGYMAALTAVGVQTAIVAGMITIAANRVVSKVKKGVGQNKESFDQYSRKLSNEAKEFYGMR